MTALPDLTGRFDVTPGFLDSATIGIPPVETIAAMQAAVADWGAGRTRPQEFDALVTEGRGIFARLVGVDPATVCVGNQVSPLAGLVAAALPDGARVLAPEGDFTSVLFPFMAQADRGVDVRLVPLERLVDEIRPGLALVALSAVQSATGEIADLDGIAAAAAAHDVRTLVDVTQACGWLPFDAGRFDYVPCAAYKWLLSARGTAFMAVRPERLAGLRPHAAGWYAGADVWTSIYGGPLRLAEDARRLDVSPAWLSWVGTVPSLRLIEEVGPAAAHAYGVGLADRVRAGLGLPPGNSAIVRVEAEGAPEALAAAGLRAASRGGAVRLSFHLHNTVEDADRAIEAFASRS